MKDVIKLMYEEIIDLLKLHGVELDIGLTYEEITKIEEIYKIKFPDSLKEFFMVALPISNGFYNWRNFEYDNINYIKHMIKKPIEDIDDLAEEVYWCDEWGEKPEDKKLIAKNVRERLKNAPKLLPIYIHRYMPMILDDNPPIVSIHGIDIIYYGESLKDYIQIEFGKKNQKDIDFQSIIPIPFWSDIM